MPDEFDLMLSWWLQLISYLHVYNYVEKNVFWLALGDVITLEVQVK